MESIMVSFIGVLIGALITYFFNVLVEKKSLKNKVYIEIYEHIIKIADKTCKAAKDIKALKISNDLERQYKHPINYADILDEMNNNVKNIFNTFRLKTNDLIDFNLYLKYHQIPLDKYKKIIDDINDKSFNIIEIIKQQKDIYDSTVSSIGYIKIENKTWDELIQNEGNLEKNVNEYIETIMRFSNDIQKDYYKDLLKIK